MEICLDGVKIKNVVFFRFFEVLFWVCLFWLIWEVEYSGVFGRGFT